ncbi:MAG: methionine--tRNA ligase [Chitinivibrionia bacterium]|nr:methionine--tRNA ligase [Chitinivibrionia bacterium]
MELYKKKNKPLLVTMALPYANGSIHLGHLVEAVIADVFVRAQKMTGRDTIYICADDTHGTPIQISAMKQNITPEQLISKAFDEHTRDYAIYGIGFDKYYTTNSEENRIWMEKIYGELQKNSMINKKTLQQFYCEHDKRFLPDRFVKGDCPKCGAQNQYGDNCEVCGASYNSEDIKNPKCSLCEKEPILKDSEHFFVDMKKEKDFLEKYLAQSDVIQDDIKVFVNNWASDLQERCISRDEPYFGFKIPDTKDKYFYVWLDAPVGYISSTQKYCDEKGIDVNKYWNENSDCEIVHIIGKDIVYFHALLWPVMLKNAKIKTPDSLFIHGFLTVEGEKMSKSRGTFILANDFAKKVNHSFAAQYLRFYFASKLTPTVSDLDFSMDEFINVINSTLVNNIGNFCNRTSTFLDRFFESVIPDAECDKEIERQSLEFTKKIIEFLLQRNFRAAIDEIRNLGSMANKYFQDEKPWELVKTDLERAKKVMATCANLIAVLGVNIKPIVPEIAKTLEEQFSENFVWDNANFNRRNKKIAPAKKLALPLEKEMLDGLYEG